MHPKNGEETVGLINERQIQRESNETFIECDRRQWGNRQLGFWTQNRCMIISHLVLIMMYSAAFLVLSSSYWQPKSLIYSPAQSAVQYKKHRYDAELVIESDYIGDPTPESDQAWHVLLQNMNIAVPASDLKEINAESISVPGEPGMYVVGLSVYHELHCLKRLRQHTWSEHYFPNQTAEDMHMNRLHTDHCIDVLRQAILCRADVALFTLEWSQDSTMPRADFSHEHQCVNWERLNAWAGERAIPDEKMASLQHPTRGAAFPDGRGSILGASLDHSATVAEDQAH